MDTLKQVLANRVIDALRAREDVVVADATVELLGEELQHVISAIVGSITEPLEEERDRGRPARHVRQGSLGHGGVEDAVSDMVELVVEQIMDSDHVDDIFADDRTLRRHSRRAIHRTLLAYVRGELEVGSTPEDVTRIEVSLESLGYVVSVVTGRLSRRRLERALRAEAKGQQGRLVALDVERRLALFELPEGTSRLQLEETITARMSELVDEEVVELPSVEQVLELTEGTSAASGFIDAVARVEAAALSELGSRARCSLLDDQTIVVTLTPLSEDAANHAAPLFERLLGMLERELVALSESPPPEAPKSQPRRRDAPKSQRRERRSGKRRTDDDEQRRPRKRKRAK